MSLGSVFLSVQDSCRTHKSRTLGNRTPDALAFNNDLDGPAFIAQHSEKKCLLIL